MIDRMRELAGKARVEAQHLARGCRSESSHDSHYNLLRLVSAVRAMVAEHDDALARLREAETLLRDAATVIERMANGASREACSPELDRLIAFLRVVAGEEETFDYLGPDPNDMDGERWGPLPS